MTIENAILVVGSLLLLILIVQQFWKQLYRSFPVFFAYQVWTLSSTVVGGFAATLAGEEFRRFYFASILVDALFQFAVLYELARVVARHNRKAPPTWRLYVLLFIPEALLLRGLSNWPVLQGLSPSSILLVRVQQTLPVLLLAFLLSVVCWSRFRSLHWPETALHIASSFGFYFLIALSVAILHTHQQWGPAYHWADVAQAGSYLCVLFYWILKL